MKNLKFELKSLKATFIVENEAKYTDISSNNVLNNINHQLKLLKAHNISQVENKISFNNTFIERGFQPTLMGILSCGEFEVLQNGAAIKVNFRCEYSLAYDFCFFLVGLLLGVFFDPTFYIWCLGGVIGFGIRYYIVPTKSNELVQKILSPLFNVA
jgi:hypothetical protein